MMLFTSISPRYPITAHRLALLIGEGIQPSISLEVVIILLHDIFTHSENGVHTNKNLEVEFLSLKKLKRFHKTRKNWNEKQYICVVIDKELLITSEGTTGDWRSKLFIPTNLQRRRNRKCVPNKKQSWKQGNSHNGQGQGHHDHRG